MTRTLAVVLSCAALAARLAAAPVPAFEDATAGSGLAFSHRDGATGQLRFVEMMGSGAALLDYDGDGDLDAYLADGGPLDAPSAEPRGRLFRNDLAPGDGGRLAPRFTDVTASSGLAPASYGMGVATGDVDDDGDVDLFLANHGRDELWLNRGDGTFKNGGWPAVAGWSSGASFFDSDRDGRLDLFVVRYVEAAPGEEPVCRAPSGRRDYCGPSSFPPTADLLYRNLGGGRFADVSRPSGVGAATGPGLGVVVVDADGDGWLDVYVANDGAPNRLWMNRRDGRFEDDAVLNGAAVNRFGLAEAGMGVDAADFDGDGDEDLFLAHLTGETNTLYSNDGAGNFTDRSLESGAAIGTLPFTGFGTRWFDLEGDGDLDLLIVNGAVRLPEQGEELGQTALLYELGEDRRYREASGAGGEFFRRPFIGRGAAFGDVDLDGDTDVLASQNGGPAVLLLNRAGDGARWAGLRLVEPSGRDALGAWIEAWIGPRHFWRRVRTDGSYQSAHDPTVPLALPPGEATGLRLRIVWPDGAVTRIQAPGFEARLWQVRR